MYMYVCMYVNIYLYFTCSHSKHIIQRKKKNVFKNNFVRFYASQCVFYLLFIIILIYNKYVVFLSLVLARQHLYIMCFNLYYILYN